MKMPEMEQVSNFDGKKKVFLRLKPGNHTIRLLPGEQGFYITFTHWVNNANIECLDDECPICSNNKKIIAENPDNFRDIKGYSRKRQVFYVNVIDRTPSKVCPSCGEVHKAVGGNFPSVCSNCNAVLVNEKTQPLNNLAILNRGSELYENLKSINNANLDEFGEKIGIENYDIMIMVPPKTRRPVAQGLPHQNDAVSIPEEELFNLEEAPLKLSADEINRFLRGASLKDIYAMRRADAIIEDIAGKEIEGFKEDLSEEHFDMDDIEEVPFDVDTPSEETVEESEEESLEASVRKLFDL